MEETTLNTESSSNHPCKDSRSCMQETTDEDLQARVREMIRLCMTDLHGFEISDELLDEYLKLHAKQKPRKWGKTHGLALYAASLDSWQSDQIQDTLAHEQKHEERERNSHPSPPKPYQQPRVTKRLQSHIRCHRSMF